MKRNISAVTVLAAVMMLLATWFGPADAAIDRFKRRPYLQNTDTVSTKIMFKVTTSRTGRVDYGLTTAYGTTVNTPTTDTLHTVSLTGLAKNTLYHYRVIAGADTSTDATFTTFNTTDQNFRFLAWGDTRSDSANHQLVINRMTTVSPAPRLVCHSGDLTANATGAEYNTFFNCEDSLQKQITQFYACGNHELYSSINNHLNNINQPNNELWFTVRYGNARFYYFDDNSTYTVGSTQYNYLLNQLLADSSDPGIRHMFFVSHSPPYTTNSGHTSELTVRSTIGPLLHRFHVNMMFNGDNHCYERSKVYTTGQVDTVHYIVTGGGGAPLYTGWNAAQSWTMYRSSPFHFCIIDIKGDSVIMRMMQQNGTLSDSVKFKTLKHTPTGPTGVEFSQFTASSSEAGIELYWRTESETDSYEWKVERSEDGVAYRNVATLPASGSYNRTSEYRWVDNEVEFDRLYHYRLALVETGGSVTYKGSVQVRADRPLQLEMNPMYLLFASPSPFSSGTEICYQANRTGDKLALKVYNVAGQLVKTLAQGQTRAGVHRVRWNGDDDKGHSVASGVYTLRLNVGGYEYFYRVTKLK